MFVVSFQLQEDPQNEEVNYLFSKINPAREQEQFVYEVISRGDYPSAISLLTQLLEVSPWSTKLREKRAQCYIDNEDILAAVSDLRSANRLSQDSTGGYFKLAELLYELGHSTDSLKEIRECLKLDPEHKDCFPFYKKVKKVEKALNDAQGFIEGKDFASCVQSADKVFKFEKEVPMILFAANQLLCTCYIKDEQYGTGIAKCREALELHKDPSVLCDRADAYVETEMYDDGRFCFFKLVYAGYNVG